MKSIYHILIVILSITVLNSCSEKKNGRLIHSYTTFNAPISCIAPSEKNADCIYYIGLENGDIIKINMLNNSQQVIHAGNNRVYDIFEENDTVLWVGVRNEGAKRITVTNGKTKTFYINSPENSARITDFYAPYTIKFDNDILYFATSSGIYTTSINSWESDSILTLCPYYRPLKHSRSSFGVNQISINDNYVYAATSDSGLVVLDKLNPRTRKTLINAEINHFYKYNDSILYASSNNNIYKINTNNQTKTIIATDDNLCAYFDTGGEKWSLTSTKIKYEDINGKSTLLLSDNINRNYKNYIYKGTYFILVACDNKLYTISLHQKIAENSNNITAACTNKDGKCFFITLDNKLYSIEKNDLRATSIGNLKLLNGDKPIKLHNGRKNLWLITNNSLFRINPSQGDIYHEIGVTESNAKIKLSNKLDFRSIAECNDSTLYVGSRNYLLKIMIKDNDIVRIDSTKTTANSNISHSDLYITDIDSSCKLFTSLKHGIFELKDNQLAQVINSDTIGEIHKIIRKSNDGNYIYSSKGVYKWTDNDFIKLNITPKTVISVCDRNNGFFVIGYRGVTGTNTKDDTLNAVNKHLDITINKAAVAEAIDIESSYIYIGSQTGLFRYDGNNNLTPIDIYQGEDNTLLIFFLIILFPIIFVSIRYYYNTQKKQIQSILSISTDKITENIKKQKANELIIKNNALSNRLYSTNLITIFKLKKDVNVFCKSIEENLLKRTEIIDSLMVLISTKVEEMKKTGVDIQYKDEWSTVIAEKNKIGNNCNDEYSIDNTIKLFNDIIIFEQKHLKKALNIKLEIKHLEIPDAELLEPLKTDVENLTIAVREKNSAEIKYICDKILKSNIDIFTLFSKLNYLDSMDDRRAHILLLYYVRSIKPQIISKAASYLVEKTYGKEKSILNVEIGKLRYSVWKQIEGILIADDKLRQNPNICHLYHRIKGKDKGL